MPDKLSSAQFSAAWADLRPTLLAHAHLLVGANDAEDLTQEAAIVAFHLLDRFNADHGRTSLRKWLLVIITNLAHNYNRSSSPREISVPEPRAYAQQKEPEGQLPITDLDNLIDVRLRHMKHRRREIWQLWRKGCTQAQIAAAMGLSKQVASYHINCILDDLRANIGGLIDPRRDGYASAEAMFRDVSRVTIYRRPQRRSAHSAPPP
jgi:RNA polymerase sigma factor (sigma-70 family)